MRHWWFQCPYRYALNKRECPRDAKLFYGITENKKSANEHLPQTYAIFLTILPQNDKIQLYLCFEEKNYILTSGGGYLRWIMTRVSIKKKQTGGRGKSGLFSPFTISQLRLWHSKRTTDRSLLFNLFTSMLGSVYYRTNSIKSKRYVNRLVQIWNCRWIWYLLFLCTDYQPIQHCIYLHTAGNQSFGFIQKPEIYDSIRRCQCVNHHSQCSC